MAKKSLTCLAAIFFAFMLVLAGCGSNSSSNSSTGQSKSSGGGGGTSSGKSVPQTLTIASTSKVVGLSPIMTNDSVSTAVISQVYETLFTRDPETMEIKPLLADSYETPDSTTWIIHLKKGIKFQDGTPFNAEAVKYTFDKIMDPKTAAPRASLLEPIKSVTVKDDNTVVIKTKEPYGPMLADLCHSNASIVSPTADKKQDLMKKPVGTGPFELAEYVPGDHVSLKANPNYWGGAPKLQTITFKVVPEVTTAISLMQTGKVQLIENPPAQQMSRLKSMKNVKIIQKQGTPVYYLGFNMTKKPMNNLKFRQAVSYAINRDAFIKQQLKGLGVRSDSIIGPKVFGYDKSAEKAGYDYDQAKAKQIIDQNGWKGVKVNLLVANTPAYKQMATVVQEELKQVGIDAQIQMMEWGTFLDVTSKGNFEMTFLGWTNSTGDGSELLYPNLDSDNIGSSNRMRYSDPQVDALIKKSRTTVDQQKRKDYLNQANILAVKSGVWIPMYHGIITVAVDKSVKGLQVEPNGEYSLANVSRE
ncbi:MAG TPA: glutathione ABC transporter substrate-binding protein [Bacillales bacterium]|nr:glutathione ABC transporter substrate-binding protein [Bacillales bacterium]